MIQRLTLYDRVARGAGWDATDATVCAILKGVWIELDNHALAPVDVRVGRLGDWWVGALSGDGLIAADGQPSARGRDFAFLTLTLPGHGRPASDSPWLRESGRIGLSRGSDGQRVAGGGQSLRYINIHIPCDDLAAAAGSHPIPFGRACSAYGGAGAILAAMLQQLAAAAIAGDAAWAMDLCSDVASIAIKALNADPGDAARSLPGMKRLTRVRAYLDAHLAEPLTPREVGRACGVSERQLFRDFSASGVTFAGELRHKRLHLAARLLVEDQGIQIAQVAEQCGFGCSQSFSRAFREAFGISPRQHRSQRHH